MITKIRAVRADLTAQDQAVLAGVAFLPVAALPVFLFGSAPRVAVVLALAPLGLLHLVVAARRHDRTSQVALAFLAVALLSALLSPAPVPSLTGSIDWWTGVVGFASFLAWWRLGRNLGAAARPIVVPLLTIGAIWNILIAVAQVALDIESGVLASPAGRGSGTMMNPVYYAAFLSGVVAAWLFLARRKLEVAIVLTLAFGVGLSGGRIAFASVVGAATVALIARLGRSTSIANFIATLVGLAAAASLFPRGGDTASATTNLATARGMGVRLDVGRAALEALRDRPLLGWGPGNIELAVERQFDASYTAARVAESGGVQRWLDAHNPVFNLAAGTGIVGTALMGVFVLLCVRQFLRVRGDVLCQASLAASATMAANWCLQPSTIHSLPLAFLFLGMSMYSAGARVELDQIEDSDPPTESVTSKSGPGPAAVRGALAVGCGLSLLLLANLFVLDRAIGNDQMELVDRVGRYGYRDPFVDQELSLAFKRAILDHDTGEMLERSQWYADRMAASYPVHFAHSVAGELAYARTDDERALEEELSGLDYQPWNPVSHRRLLLLAALFDDEERYWASVDALCEIGVPECADLRRGGFPPRAEEGE